MQSEVLEGFHLDHESLNEEILLVRQAWLPRCHTVKAVRAVTSSA